MSYHIRGLGGVAFSVLLAMSASAKAAPADTVACVEAGERPWLDKTLTAECRASLLLKRIGTTEAKLAALATDFRDFGVEPSRGSDGPVGPTRTPGSYNLPAPIALAASFDPSLMSDIGTLVGREFRAAGLRTMLGPTLDVARSWQFGRVAEDYGEDPFLTGRMAVPYIRAIQAQGVAVTLKHYAVYSQEQGRTGDSPIGERPAVNVVLSERTLRELYLPAFRAAVVEGGALGVMCSFPRVNGIYACENAHLLDILKSEWGFRGTVGPDFPDAQRSVIAAINAGMDSGNFGLPRPNLGPPPSSPAGTASSPAPGGAPPATGEMTAIMSRVPGGIDLRTALRVGKISATRFDDLLRRKLVTMFALDTAPAPGALDPAATAALAQRAAIDGAVLLRNEGGILPLGPSVRSIAVIGAQAGDKPQRATTGSANVRGIGGQSAYAAIAARASGIRVSYAEGSRGLDPLPAVPTSLLRTPDGKPGLQAVYVANPRLDFEATPVMSRDEPTASSHGPQPVPGLPGDNQWSVRWSGTLVPRVSGIHDFTLAGGGSARLSVGGALVARYDRVDFGTVEHGAADLQAGRAVEIVVEYTPREAAAMMPIPMMGTTLGTTFDLGIAEPDDRIGQAVSAAKAADVAIVFAANRQGEGADRAMLALSPDQDRLITAVATANRHTVVVLSTGGAVAMPWRDKVAGIMETWYSGDAFGPAVASLLMGDATPGGRLPLTFPANAEQGPAVTATHYPGLTNDKGELTDVRYDEGTLVGYRWHLAHPEQKPLYPFGFGLSYGDVRLSRMSIAARSVGSVHISLNAVNRGQARAVNVVQAYVVLDGDKERQTPKLAGFAKVALEPGEARDIVIDLPSNIFDVWSEHNGAWEQWRGAYELRVGGSSVNAMFRQRLRR